LRLLAVGDVVGRPGREALRRYLPLLRERFKPAVVVVNGENAAGGRGITPAIAKEILGWGADAITLGNHGWDRREAWRFLKSEPRVLCPLNHPPLAPGNRSLIFVLPQGFRLALVLLAGRVFQPEIPDCPFRAIDAFLTRMSGAYDALVVEIHGEASSEKAALAWYLDGRAAAVLGSHTHVQTADATILPGGCAFITDIGMTGPVRSVIGMEVDGAIRRFRTQLPVRLEVARGPGGLDAVLVDIDERTGRASRIQPFRMREGESENPE